MGGGATLKSLKKSKSISGILGWVLTFLELAPHNFSTTVSPVSFVEISKSKSISGILGWVLTFLELAPHNFSTTVSPVSFVEISIVY